MFKFYVEYLKRTMKNLDCFLQKEWNSYLECTCIHLLSDLDSFVFYYIIGGLFITQSYVLHLYLQLCLHTSLPFFLNIYFSTYFYLSTYITHFRNINKIKFINQSPYIIYVIYLYLFQYISNVIHVSLLFYIGIYLSS